MVHDVWPLNILCKIQKQPFAFQVMQGGSTKELNCGEELKGSIH